MAGYLGGWSAGWLQQSVHPKATRGHQMAPEGNQKAPEGNQKATRGHQRAPQGTKRHLPFFGIGMIKSGEKCCCGPQTMRFNHNPFINPNQRI